MGYGARQGLGSVAMALAGSLLLCALPLGCGSKAPTGTGASTGTGGHSTSASTGTGGHATGGQGTGGGAGGCMACTVGATKCAGAKVEECVGLANGCTTWGAAMDCPSGKACTGAACPTCSDACKSGDTQCSGTQVQLCQKQADGCLEFGPPADCPNSEACTNGACPTCTDACTAGTTQCSGTQVETCTVLASGCTAWGAAQDCPDGACTNGACPACINACTAGATQCMGTGVETCTTLASGCTAWGSPSACAAGDVCSNGQCCESGALDSWPADGTAADVVGANNGTLVNGAGYTTGEVGQAFSFNGTNQYATFGTTAGNFGTSDFTIDFWIKTTSAHEDIISKRAGCGPGSFIDVRTATGPIQFEMEQDSSGTNHIDMLSTKTVIDGNWHYVALVRQGAAATIYIDGALDSSSSSASATQVSNTAALEMGAGPCIGADGTTYFSGSLDQVSFFGVALTAAQIQATFASGAAARCIQ